MAQMKLSTEKKQTHGHGEQICGCQGRGEWVGWTEIWGFKKKENTTKELQKQIIDFNALILNTGLCSDEAELDSKGA